MSMLMRAPRECGSWWFEIDDIASPGLHSALAVAARAIEVLAKHDLLKPHKLEYGWHVPETGWIPITTTLDLTVALVDPGLAEQLLQSRPSGYPTAEVTEIRVLGSGTWTDAEGQKHSEPRLVDVEISHDPFGVALELTVHHDIWKHYDFAGHPHPEVQACNAPRLAAALRELEATLDVKAVPGEPTYFGAAEGYGIEKPEPSEDGSGPNLTDKF